MLLEKSHAVAWQDKLAVVLWQLPKTLPMNLPRLSQFSQALQQWPEVRHAIEFRHPSWFVEETAACLTETGISACLSDAGNWPYWDRVTSDLVYLRLHGKPQCYVSSYDTQALSYWAQCIAHWLQQEKQVHAYFDNDIACAAPHNAKELQALVDNSTTP